MTEKTYKDKISEKEEAPKKVSGLTNDELYNETRQARKELVKIIEAARDTDNAEAQINFNKASKELDDPDIETKAVKLRRQVDEGSAELQRRHEQRKYEEVLAQGFERVPEKILDAKSVGNVLDRHKNMFDYLASKESPEFQDQYKARASLQGVVENYQNIDYRDFLAAGKIFSAVNTTANTISVNDNRDEGRLVMYNDPRTPMHLRLPVVAPIQGGDSYTYIKELGAGGDGNKKANTIATKAEGADYAEQEMQTKNVTVVVKKVTGFAQVTEEQLDDVAAARAFITMRLTKNFGQAVETQVVSGNGQGTNWTGLLTQSNLQTVTKTGAIKKLDIFIDAYEKGTGVAYAMPDILGLRSDTHAHFSKLKDADGNYLWASVINGLPNLLLGLPITICQHLPANTGLMLSSMEFAILNKQGMTMEWGKADGDFRAGRESVRAKARGNVLAWKENAAIKIAGLGVADTTS